MKTKFQGLFFLLLLISFQWGCNEVEMIKTDKKQTGQEKDIANLPVGPTSYYVSTSGSDSNDGLAYINNVK